LLAFNFHRKFIEFFQYIHPTSLKLRGAGPVDDELFGLDQPRLELSDKISGDALKRDDRSLLLEGKKGKGRMLGNTGHSKRLFGVCQQETSGYFFGNFPL